MFELDYYKVKLDDGSYVKIPKPRRFPLMRAPEINIFSGAGRQKAYEEGVRAAEEAIIKGLGPVVKDKFRSAIEIAEKKGEVKGVKQTLETSLRYMQDAKLPGVIVRDEESGAVVKFLPTQRSLLETPGEYFEASVAKKTKGGSIKGEKNLSVALNIDLHTTLPDKVGPFKIYGTGEIEAELDGKKVVVGKVSNMDVDMIMADLETKTKAFAHDYEQDLKDLFNPKNVGEVRKLITNTPIKKHRQRYAKRTGRVLFPVPPSIQIATPSPPSPLPTPSPPTSPPIPIKGPPSPPPTPTAAPIINVDQLKAQNKDLKKQIFDATEIEEIVEALRRLSISKTIITNSRKMKPDVLDIQTIQPSFEDIRQLAGRVKISNLKPSSMKMLHDIEKGNFTL